MHSGHFHCFLYSLSCRLAFHPTPYILAPSVIKFQSWAVVYFDGFPLGTRLAPFADPFVCPAALSPVTAPSLSFWPSVCVGVRVCVWAECYRISIVLGGQRKNLPKGNEKTKLCALSCWDTRIYTHPPDINKDVDRLWGGGVAYLFMDRHKNKAPNWVPQLVVCGFGHIPYQYLES